MSIYVSRNFRFSEFVCPCGCGKDRPIDPKLIYLLQNLRDKIDRPIYITSGLRCKAYNKKIKGYVNSSHLKGRAIDCRAKSMNIVSLAEQAKRIGFSRIGIYKTFLHLDTLRPSPSASWVRDIQGKYHYFKTLEEAIICVGKY